MTDLIKYGIGLLERMRIDVRGGIHEHLHRRASLYDISKKAKVESLESLQQQTPAVIVHPRDSNTKPLPTTSHTVHWEAQTQTQACTQE